MNKKIFFPLIFAISIMTLLFSCDEDAPSQPEPEKNPEIVSVSPDSVQIGEEINISGANFGAVRGTSIVQFDGVTADEDADFILWSAASIKMKVPVGAKRGFISVTVNDIKSNEVLLKIYDKGPDDPDSVYISYIGSDSALAAEEIEIFGKGFGNVQDNGYVDFGGVKAANYISWSDEKIVVKTPGTLNIGNYDVTVHAKGKVSNTKILKIYVPEPDPSIVVLVPAMAKVGTSIRVAGSAFGDMQNGSWIEFNGKKATMYSSWSNTEIYVTVPDGATTGLVTFHKSNGKVSNGVNFTVQEDDPDPEDPIITSLDSQSGLPGTQLGINGKNFGSSRGDSYVEFNGVRPNDTGYLTWTDKKIVVIIPDAAKTGNVVVTVGGKASNGISLTVTETFKLLKLVEIPVGSFIMGKDTKDTVDYKPAHNVTITKPFYMSETEITQKQWRTIMEQSNPSKYALGDNYPVEQVTWIRAVEFCNSLSKQEGFTPCYTIAGENVTCNFDANGYRLPTEAEWEYACRAGNTGDYGFSGNIDDNAWTANNSDITTNPVKQKNPNPWGLYDMHGNVAEWCWDEYDYSFYEVSPSTDPKGTEDGYGDKVVRGGSYRNGPDFVKSYLRYSYAGVNDNFNSDLGFRVVRKK